MNFKLNFKLGELNICVVSYLEDPPLLAGEQLYWTVSARELCYILLMQVTIGNNGEVMSVQITK